MTKDNVKWVAGNNSAHGTEVIEITDQNIAVTVAWCPTTHIHSTSGFFFSTQQTLVHAKMIAALPDMIRLLKSLEKSDQTSEKYRQQASNILATIV